MCVHSSYPSGAAVNLTCIDLSLLLSCFVHIFVLLYVALVCVSCQYSPKQKHFHFLPHMRMTDLGIPRLFCA